MDNYDKNREAARVSRKHFDETKTGSLETLKGPRRGDFPLCRRLDKLLIASQKHKDPASRKAIFAEYHGLQKEQRKYG